MSFNLCTSGAIWRKSGAHNSIGSLASSGAILAEYCDQAEAEICEAVDYDLITNYSTILANIKPAIAKAVASKAAMEVIAYDPTGYLNSENQLILDVLNNQSEKIVASLKTRQKKWDKLGS